jgi:hypothetical protein
MTGHQAPRSNDTLDLIDHALTGTSPDQARLRFDPESPTTDRRWPHNH